MKEMISRDNITNKLREALEPLPFIYAFWLEGADAIGTVDEYSDISQHIPEVERERLEYFARINSLDSIEEKIPQAGRWFDELAERLGDANG